MISFKEKIINLNDVIYPITDYVVWFQTPKGLSTNLQLAIEVCEGMDIDPDIHIRPVAVAITDAESVYEIL